MSDSTFYRINGLGWKYNYGKYSWSNDTIYFRVIPVYDTMLTIYKNSDLKEQRLILSRDTIPNLIINEMLKVEHKLLVVSCEGSESIQLELVSEQMDYNKEETIEFPIQVLEEFPQFLIKKHKGLGYYDSKRQFVREVRKDREYTYLEWKYIKFRYCVIDFINKVKWYIEYV